MVGLASAAGLVGFLSEPDPELRVFALKTLDSQIDLLWTEVVDAVPQMLVSLNVPVLPISPTNSRHPYPVHPQYLMNYS